MKYLFFIILLFITYSSFSQIDSFKRDGIMYYTYDTPTKPVRLFMPVKTEVVHNTFKISDTACKEKRNVIFNPDNMLLTYYGMPKNGLTFNSHPCSENPRNIVCDFTDSWACINPEAYKAANFKQGEVLQYDGCRLYRNNVLIAPVEHRGFIIHTGKPFTFTSYTTHTGIATTIIFQQ